jgi:hypothetical protein
MEKHDVFGDGRSFATAYTGILFLIAQFPTRREDFIVRFPIEK